jgi:predicted nucleic acid-binding protein
MGLMLDTSVLIANERGQLDLPAFLRQFPSSPVGIAAITASELLHGVERARDPVARARRQSQVEQILGCIRVYPFDLTQARSHARLWADLERRGLMIGSHDLQIAATALVSGFQVATLNVREFRHVADLGVLDASHFLQGCNPSTNPAAKPS